MKIHQIRLKSGSTLAAVVLLLPSLCLGGDVEVSSFSPQGLVTAVTQARATFTEPMVAFGDLKKESSPFKVNCNTVGHPRWLNQNTWVYEFESPLGAGIQCQFKLKAGIRSLSGTRTQGQR